MNLYLHRPIANGVGRVSQWFGEHPLWYDKFGLSGHNGLDYAIPLNTPILAAHDGVVVKSAYDEKGYGNYIVLRGTTGLQSYETIYAHLTKALVEINALVVAQQQIGLSGTTGNSTGPHLHFGLRIIGMRNPAYKGYIDPVPFRS